MSKPTPYCIFIFLIFIIKAGNGAGDSASKSTLCDTTYNCGNGVVIKYPFWHLNDTTSNRYCGYPNFGISCSNGDPWLRLPSETYRVRNISYTDYTITLVDADAAKQECPRVSHNVTLGDLPLSYSNLTSNLSFYFNCTSNPFSHNAFSIDCFGLDSRKSYVTDVGSDIDGVDWLGKCGDHVVAAVMITMISDLINGYRRALNQGFLLDWRTARDCRACEASHGFCGYDDTEEALRCFCKNGEVKGGSCKDYTECKKPYNCGHLNNLSYPFWGDNRPAFCGREGFRLNHCQDQEDPLITILGEDFRVIRVNQSFNRMIIARGDLYDDVCPNIFRNIILDRRLFRLDPEGANLSLAYGCTTSPSTTTTVNYSCYINGEEGRVFYGSDELWMHDGLDMGRCDRLELPVLLDRQALEEKLLSLSFGNGLEEVRNLLREGFNVSYEFDPDIGKCKGCENSGGICGTNSSTSSFGCFCTDNRCPKSPGSGSKVKLKIGIGVAAALGGGLLTCAIFFIYQYRNKKKYTPSSFFSRSITSDPSSKTDFEKGGNSLGVPIFTYAELEEATNNFDSSKELGDGGFGTVYYGKLRDGRAVAVKRLYENNYRRVEQFMNEVKILTHLRHQHLVTLYGCTSRHSRELLLVYEYISNGTVADHLHGERAKPGALPWPTRMNIAVDTASALAYLHASDIIHRDVKTNNILLDNHFCVKVADFGLSRLFPTDVTHVSTAPQGTPGYVDPEYHQCYQLTDKSDVYSFGVVLIELISSMPAVDITRHRHEINLANMAINKIQSHALHELVDPNLGFESDYKARKMMAAVAELAFRCLQCEKELRPSMEEVLQILEEIRRRDYSSEKAQKIDNLSDDIVLLKNSLPPLSPDSVTVKWISLSSTPSSSS